MMLPFCTNLSATEDCDLLDFAPVPVRARRDGWMPRRQRLFVRLLRHGRCRTARRIGMTKQTAYALRRRPGAAELAAAWDRAVALAARDRLERWRAARKPGLAERALCGYWTPRHYRGRIVSWTFRLDNRAAMVLLRRLDRYVERHPGLEEATAGIDVEQWMEVVCPGSPAGLGDPKALWPDADRCPCARPGGEIRRESPQLCQFPRAACAPSNAIAPTAEAVAPTRDAAMPTPSPRQG